jgi:hypothetical protein
LKAGKIFKIKIFMKKNFLTTKGFVILFASIIATIILIMSFAIYTVSIKSSALSIGAGEALDAFYAADAGIECGLLVLDLSTGAGMGPIGSMPVNIDCGGLPGVGNISFASGPYPFYYAGHLDPVINPSACYAGTIDEDTRGMNPMNFDMIKTSLGDNISKFLYQKTAKHPLVIPVLLSI